MSITSISNIGASVIYPIPGLIPCPDSNSIEAYPVYGTFAYIAFSHEHGYSTVANEACALIQGYRTGRYPPYCTIPIWGGGKTNYPHADILKPETLKWWGEQKFKN